MGDHMQADWEVTDRQARMQATPDEQKKMQMAMKARMETTMQAKIDENKKAQKSEELDIKMFLFLNDQEKQNVLTGIGNDMKEAVKKDNVALYQQLQAKRISLHNAWNQDKSRKTAELCNDAWKRAKEKGQFNDYSIALFLTIFGGREMYLQCYLQMIAVLIIYEVYGFQWEAIISVIALGSIVLRTEYQGHHSLPIAIFLYFASMATWQMINDSTNRWHIPTHLHLVLFTWFLTVSGLRWSRKHFGF